MKRNALYGGAQDVSKNSELLFFNNPTIDQINGAVTSSRQPWVMGHDQNSATKLFIELSKQFENITCGLCIQITSGLISQQ